MPWKPKTSEDGNLALEDGLPVFVDDEGTEMAFDPNRMHDKILTLNSKDKAKRLKLEAAEARLKSVADIEDLDEFVSTAREAMETVKNLEDSQKLQAGEVEKIKQDAREGIKAQEEKLKAQFADREQELQGLLTQKDGHIRNLLISSQFAQHELFGGTDPRTILPPEIAETYFGGRFEVQDVDGKLRVVGKDATGEVIMSKDPKRIGEPARFAEAMDSIFSEYPGKEKLLRAGSGGSGAAGGGSGPAGARTPLSTLKAQFAEAQKKGDAATMTRLKTQIYDLQRANS